jgi:hypothetical protein
MGALSNIITRIKAVITADNKDFKRKMKQTERQAAQTGKRTGSSFKSMSGTIKAAAGAAIVMIGVKMVRALHGLTKEMGLMSFKANAVFGLYRKEVEEMADDTATAMGLTKTEFVNAAAGIQDLLIPIGFARKEATRMTKDTMKLAGAMSAWTGGMVSAKEVGLIFSKAVLGEREQLKTLGIAISEAEVKARLLEKGQSKLTGQYLAQAKAQATLEIITEKSTDAQQAFADEQDNVVIKSAQVGANLRSMAENLTTVLGPAVDASVGFLANLTAGMKSLSDESAMIASSNVLTPWEKALFRLSGLAPGMAGVVKQMELLAIAGSEADFNKMVDELLDIDASLEVVEQALAGFGDLALQHGREYYAAQKKLREKDAQEVEAQAKVSNEAVLAEQKAGYWAMEAALMAHNAAMSKLDIQGFGAHRDVINGTVAQLDTYHTSLGALMERYPLIIPIIHATTTAEEANKDAIQQSTDEWNKKMDAVGLGQEMMSALTQSIVHSSSQAEASFRSVASTAVNTAKTSIGAAIAKGIAGQVSSALESIPFPFGLIAAGLAGGAAAAIFQNIIPSFAEGGVVTGPTLAMVGDNPSGREAMIPSELWDTLGGSAEVEVTGIVRGNDLYLMNKRTKEKLERTGRHGFSGKV